MPVWRFALLSLVMLGACQRPAEVAVGKSAPPYSARTVSGDSVALASFIGRPVLLNVWATWCEPCLQEIPYLELLYSTRHASGLEIIGVSLDGPGAQDAIQAFATEHRMTYPIWHDPDRRVTNTFRSIGVPASYLVDREGILRWQRVGIIRASDTRFLAVLDSVLQPRATP